MRGMRCVACGCRCAALPYSVCQLPKTPATGGGARQWAARVQVCLVLVLRCLVQVCLVLVLGRLVLVQVCLMLVLGCLVQVQVCLVLVPSVASM